MITIDLKEVTAKDLHGNTLRGELCKVVGNIIFMKATDLEWDELSREIYKGEPVQLTVEQCEIIREVIIHPETQMIIPFKKALNEYLTTLKNNANEQVKDNAKKD